MFDNSDGLLVGMETETKLTRIVDTVVYPSSLVITTDVIPMENATDDDLRLIMGKVSVFFDSIVERCIAFDASNGMAIDMLIDEEGKNRTSNLLMLTPGDPTDEILAAVFTAKMRALGKGIIWFDNVKVISDNALGLNFSFLGDPDVMLPSNQDWIGEKSFFDRPWWHRDDGSTIDVVPPPDADLSEKPAWAFPLEAPPPAPQIPQNAPIGSRDFVPFVIDGGKKED